LLDELEKRRHELLEQLKSLDAEQRKALEGKPRQQKPIAYSIHDLVMPASPDRLERILDRLERLEKRLDRLESSRRPSEGKRP
jgi:hypothetical protein